MKRRSRWMLVAGTILTMGCADAAAISGTDEIRGPSPTVLAADDPVPWPVRIRLAGLNIDVFEGTVTPYMWYDGFHAALGGTATLLAPGTSSNYTFAPVEKDTWGFWNFLDNHHTHTWQVPVQPGCGQVLWANISYKASFRAINPESGLVTLLEVNTTRTQGDETISCPTEDVTEPEDGVGSGSGGGFGDTPDGDNRPRRVCVYRYYYNVETGAVLYREELFCY